MKQKKKTKKRIGRPNLLLYLVAMAFLAPYYRLRYRVKIDRSGLRDLRGPALILAPHTSGKDHILVSLALFPHRPTFVMSEHFLSGRFFRWILGKMRVISKKMFCADAKTVMGILRAKSEGNLIVLFPEGRLPACAHSVPVTEGTAALVKKLGIPVYVVTANGASLTFPKWAEKPRRGKIRVTTEKLFDETSLASLTEEEIGSRIRDTLRHDDERAMEGVRYRAKNPAAGVTGILRRCPVCWKFGTLTEGNAQVGCSCGAVARIDECYRVSGVPVSSVNAWFDWQQKSLRDLPALEREVTVGARNGRGNLTAGAGTGTVRLSRDTFSFAGTLFGEPLSFTIPTRAIGGFPVTVGRHFDLYHENRLLRMYPTSDGRDAILFTAFLDRLKETEGDGVTPGR